MVMDILGEEMVQIHANRLLYLDVQLLIFGGRREEMVMDAGMGDFGERW